MAQDAVPPRFFIERIEVRDAKRVSTDVVIAESRLRQGQEYSEADLRDLEEELADPGAWSTPAKAERAEKRHRQAKEALADLLERWEQAEAETDVPGGVSSGGDRA